MIELTASLEARLSRNKTENRLANKPSKSDWKVSEEQLLWSEDNHVLNSFKAIDFQLPSFVKNHLIINNENLSVEEVAAMIIKETCNCGG